MSSPWTVAGCRATSLHFHCRATHTSICSTDLAHYSRLQSYAENAFENSRTGNCRGRTSNSAEWANCCHASSGSSRIRPSLIMRASTVYNLFARLPPPRRWSLRSYLLRGQGVPRSLPPQRLLQGSRASQKRCFTFFFCIFQGGNLIVVISLRKTQPTPNRDRAKMVPVLFHTRGERRCHPRC